MSPETPRDDPAMGASEPVHVSVHVALDVRRNVWLEVDLEGKRVAPETARNLSSLLMDMATVAEKLRGNQTDRNSHAVAPDRNHRPAPAGDRNNQAPAAAPAGMPTQWQEVDHDEPRYTGPAQAPGGQAPNAQGPGGQAAGGGQGAGNPQDRQ